MILALNGAEFGYGFDGFGDFGAAPSGPVAAMQTALRDFGKNIGDTTLAAIAVDGLIGPKTVAAANRALTRHLGAGQAPQALRSGALNQAQVVAAAAQIAQLINTEARRRGFAIYVGPITVGKQASAGAMPLKKGTNLTVAQPAPQLVAQPANMPAVRAPASAPAPVARQAAPVSRGGESAYLPATAAPVPVYSPAAERPNVTAQLEPTKTYVVPGTSSVDTAGIVKWGAIGLGVVAVLGGIYYAVTRRRQGGGAAPAMAGFGATSIETPFGKRVIARRVGRAREYYETLPTPSAPHGEWWVLNPQTGFVPVASNNRGLKRALVEDDEEQMYNRDLRERIRNRPFRVADFAGKPIEEMTAGEINKRLDRLDRQSSELTDEFIAAGRGHELPSETAKLDDPLARRKNQLFTEHSALHREIERRYGPGAPSRLPRGFRPVKGF
jgi:hypothetical protein